MRRACRLIRVLVTVAALISLLSSNPLSRLELAAIERIDALCGGNATLGTIVFDSLLFLIGASIAAALLAWVGWRIRAAQ
jgi:hypothetical protein